MGLGGVVEAGVTCEPLVAASGNYATPGGASTSTSFQHVPPYDLRGRKSPLHLHDASTAGFNATAPVHPTATRPTSPTASATASVLQSAATPPLSQPARKRLRRNTSCTITSSDSKYLIYFNSDTFIVLFYCGFSSKFYLSSGFILRLV